MNFNCKVGKPLRLVAEDETSLCRGCFFSDGSYGLCPRGEDGSLSCVATYGGQDLIWVLKEVE